jgi:glucose/arabinose dehydrogenase
MVSWKLVALAILVLLGLEPALARYPEPPAASVTQPAPLATIKLLPVLTGLSSPVFVTTARDGSNRLFVVEQGGVIKVLQPGSSSPTVFLDITANVLSGGERGLLGLTFHPHFSSNRRFFVNYTRQPDGATVIAEYQASPADPNVADPTERVLLVIAQPFANHNGGMVEFGPDGFLYIGMGDGGSGNDPGNRAQNTAELLGKILRIDVDQPDGSQPYSSPSTNPFAGSTAGRDEIFAYGFRNPWRFSFDRATGDLYVGDVGQNAVEEIDIVTLGGNYGWRVWEGTSCTANDPGLCDPTGFVFPIAEYTHAGGRCAVTGGYVYRGSRSSVPAGSYLYADFCTGEIFRLQNGASSLLLDSGLSLSAFGEDEAGELYVVDLGGTVQRIAAVNACSFGLSPTSLSAPATAVRSAVRVSAAAGCGWTAASNDPWITVTSGASGNGNGFVVFSVASNQATTPRTGSLTIADQTFPVSQSAAACVASISPPAKAFPPAGGTGTVAVTTGDGCSWTASSNVGWITITSSQTGSGSGTVSYAVGANSGRWRTGTVTIAGRTFTVLSF